MWHMAQQEKPRRKTISLTLSETTVRQLRQWSQELGISVSSLVEIITRTCGPEVVTRIRQRGP